MLAAASLLKEKPSSRFRLARNARAYTSARSIGFCAIWVCISPSSSSAEKGGFKGSPPDYRAEVSEVHKIDTPRNAFEGVRACICFQHSAYTARSATQHGARKRGYCAAFNEALPVQKRLETLL